MKLTQRERVLLGILAFVLLSWIYYEYIFIPQTAAIEETQAKLASLEKTRDEILSYTDPQGAIQRQLAELEQKIAAATEKFFPELIQERIIRNLDQMLASAVLEGKVLTFSPITVGTILEKGSGKDKDKTININEQPFSLRDLTNQLNKQDTKNTPPQPPLAGDGNIYKMEVTVEFSGQYNQTLAFMSQLENSKRKILISNLNLGTETPGKLSGTMGLHFYGIPKMHQQDQEYVTWDIFDVYGRANPFTP